jgi:alkylation response protein AidB-like acyl-CoA dehydrogenase
VIEAAERAAALLAGRSAEIEAARRLPPDVADTLAGLGLMRLLTPAAYGGAELHPAEFFRVIERVARADASAAWCCFVASTSSLVAAYLDPAVAAPLFGRPALKAAGVFAPRGQAGRERRDGVDGVRVRGRWAWGSGVQHADLVVVGCLVPGADGRPQTLASGAPRVLSAVVEACDVRPLDNWNSVGLCGTGSGEFEIADAWVPLARTTCLMDGAPRVGGPLYRFPVFGLLALAIAATASGIARLALDEFVALAAGKVPQGGQRALAQRATVQEAVACAEARWRGARAFAFEAVDAAWGEAARDGAISVGARRDMRLAATHLVHEAAAVVDRVFTLAGGHAVFADSPLQRCLRDVHVATQHMMVSGATLELTGRLLLGQPTAVDQL